MTELHRLVDESQSSRTRALLRAGRAETSPDGFTERLLASVGAAAATSAVSSTAAASLASGTHAGGAFSGAAASSMGAAASSVGASSLTLVAVKWVAIGVLGGAMLATGADFALSPRHEPERAPTAESAPPRSTAPVPALRSALPLTAPERAPTAGVSPVRASSPPRAAHGSRASAAPGSSASQLGREVELIERVRRALSAGNTSLALTELDAYQRITSTGVLDREARVLRIRALREGGDEASARKLSEQYLLDFPGDAHAQRLKAQDAKVKP